MYTEEMNIRSKCSITKEQFFSEVAPVKLNLSIRFLSCNVLISMPSIIRSIFTVYYALIVINTPCLCLVILFRKSYNEELFTHTLCRPNLILEHDTLDVLSRFSPLVREQTKMDLWRHISFYTLINSLIKPEKNHIFKLKNPLLI